MVASCSSCVTREGPAAGGHEFILPASPAPLGWSQQHKERLGRAPGGGFHHQLTVPEAGGSVQAAQGITCTPLCALGCKYRLPQPTGKRWPGRIRNFQGAIPRCCGEHQLLPPQAGAGGRDSVVPPLENSSALPGFQLPPNLVCPSLPEAALVLISPKGWRVLAGCWQCHFHGKGRIP